MIEYRPFRNTDPPRLLSLWHQAGLGRGAAEGFSCDILETLVFAQPYFDPAGLIVACEGSEIVGLVHAGFGPGEAYRLSRDVGVICAVIVHPEHRGAGIGRELVRRAEEFLRSAGAGMLLAGPAEPYDPFYFGLYGGSQTAGFLESDPAAEPFFRALGYVPHARHRIYHRDLAERSEPMGLRLMSIRRSTKVAVPREWSPPDWWWVTRKGRLDSIQLAMCPKAGGDPLASITVLGLDLYLPKWQCRAIGLVDLWVEEPQRRKGYGQSFVVEVCRRVRSELITRVEAHAAESNPGAIAVFESAGFEQVDAGIVYRKAD